MELEFYVKQAQREEHGFSRQVWRTVSQKGPRGGGTRSRLLRKFIGSPLDILSLHPNFEAEHVEITSLSGWSDVLERSGIPFATQLRGLTLTIETRVVTLSNINSFLRWLPQSGLLDNSIAVVEICIMDVRFEGHFQVLEELLVCT